MWDIAIQFDRSPSQSAPTILVLKTWVSLGTQYGVQKIKNNESNLYSTDHTYDQILQTKSYRQKRSKAMVTFTNIEKIYSSC